MVSSRECSFSLSKIDDNCCASPLLVVLGSLLAVKSNTLRPLKTNPTITPSNAFSIRCLVLFHRPPTWIVDCLLNTLSWCPANNVNVPRILYRLIQFKQCCNTHLKGTEFAYCYHPPATSSLAPIVQIWPNDRNCRSLWHLPHRWDGH